ncbi:uncharacterized protein LOC119138429 [Syngnathus acus]|uniref:uncharacterized protein LOC119138429 n=1 Tax=Syngnathus acus TaxID=161584 RepID=UPI001885D9CE|nr:uncharacterized protein LOC119138429 [Syngnathus acus]
MRPILFMLLISTSVSSCPDGAHVHLASLRCFWLSEKTSTWSEASASCQRNDGGRVAAAGTAELQNFLRRSFPVKSTLWVWIHGANEENADKIDFSESASHPWRDGGSDDKGEVCTQMALGTPGQWRSTPCVKPYHFICQNSLNESLPAPDTYVVGVVLMTGIYRLVQIEPLASVPDVEQLAVEMQLFPGLWFSHAGRVTSLEAVVQPSMSPCLARFQILRPYCSPNYHLVPPGCPSLMNPFSCCSTVALCNTTGGCGTGRYWCHILEACLSNHLPCSPYTSAAGGGFALPPRSPPAARAPFYHLVADLPLEISPSSQMQTFSVLLPEEAITVYPDDVVAIQHTRDPGAFLRCLASEAALNSPWRQSYLSLQGSTKWGGWWEGGLAFPPPQGEHWVDEVVCDLRLLYEDPTPRGATEQARLLETTAASGIKSPSPSAASTLTPCGYEAVAGLDVEPRGRRRMLVDVPQSFTAQVERGSSVTFSWVMDNLDAFAYEGESYSVVFEKPAEHKLKGSGKYLNCTLLIIDGNNNNR